MQHCIGSGGDFSHLGLEVEFEDLVAADGGESGLNGEEVQAGRQHRQLVMKIRW
jgi:hypothetical protein